MHDYQSLTEVMFMLHYNWIISCAYTLDDGAPTRSWDEICLQMSGCLEQLLALVISIGDSLCYINPQEGYLNFSRDVSSF